MQFFENLEKNNKKTLFFIFLGIFIVSLILLLVFMKNY